jgi:hypothetical protein
MTVSNRFSKSTIAENRKVVGSSPAAALIIEEILRRPDSYCTFFAHSAQT